MSSKSQTELEQPAKVYQLDALGEKVDQALKKLDQIANSVNGVATQAQVETMAMKVKADIRSEIDGEIEKVHLEYRPVKNNITWFTRAVIVEGIAIVGQAVIIYVIAKG